MPTSADGVVTAEVNTDWSYVMLRINSAEASVRVWRSVGGTVSLVRSGDTARVVAGVAVACDTEAPLGVPVTYWADDSDTVEVVVPDLAGQEADTLLRPVTRPSDSVPLMVESWPSLTRPVRQSVSWVVGRRDPVIEWDVRGTAASTLTAVVWSPDARDLLLTAVDSGVVMLSPPSVMGRGPVYAVVGDLAVEQIGVASAGYWRATMPLQEVARPATAGAPLLVPGMGYLDNPTLTGSYLDSLGV